MGQTNGIELSLLEFLDTIGAALDSTEGWSDSEDLWRMYVDKAGVPDDRRHMFTDWSEVGPAMKALAVMIRARVFIETHAMGKRKSNERTDESN